MVQYAIVGMIGLALFASIYYPVKALKFLFFLPSGNCPRCRSNHSLTRLPRRAKERWLGRIIPCRKFVCMSCQWTGLLRVDEAKLAELEATRGMVPSGPQGPSL